METETLPNRRPIRFTLKDAQKAGDEWRFNCGPSALCAVLHKTPEEIRPHLLDFESKGYTNPTLMIDILRALKVPHQVVYRNQFPGALPAIKWGLMRVQFAGPWTAPGVPIQARYRHTHWVACRDLNEAVFDVNAMCVGGWLPWKEWSQQLIPWLIKQCYPKADGNWWATHAIEVLS